LAVVAPLRARRYSATNPTEKLSLMENPWCCVPMCTSDAMTDHTPESAVARFERARFYPS